MRKTQRTMVIIVATCFSAAFGVVAPAGAASASSTTTGHRDYLSSASATGNNQCAKSLASRQGAWFCVRPADTPRARASASSLATASGICSVIGCWYYIASYWASFMGNGIYGYGSTTLGDITLYADDKFSGGSSTTKPFQFESTRGTRTVFASGERLYFSTAHPEGNPFCCYKTWGPNGPYAANVLVNCFGSTGYTAYENSVAWAGIVHEWAWTDPSSAYPGRWFAWVKSPKFQRNSSGQYILNNPIQMGLDWYGSGWSPT